MRGSEFFASRLHLMHEVHLSAHAVSRVQPPARLVVPLTRPAEKILPTHRGFSVGVCRKKRSQMNLASHSSPPIARLFSHADS